MIDFLERFVLIGHDNGLYDGIIANPPFQASFPETVSIRHSSRRLWRFAQWAAGQDVSSQLSSVTHLAVIGGAILNISALLQVAAYGIPQLIISRMISDLGYGLVISTVPILSSETSERRPRGRPATVNFLLANVSMHFALGCSTESSSPSMTR